MIDAGIYLNSRNRGPSFFIAGGAIRDSLFGKPVKDLDVFQWLYGSKTTLADVARRGIVHYTSAGTITGWDHGISGRTKPFIAFHKSPTPYGESTEFCSMYSNDVPGVNLILIPESPGVGTLRKSVLKFISNFPVSISQVAYLPAEDELIYTEAFAESAETKVVKYISGDYANRIYSKYADWLWERW